MCRNGFFSVILTLVVLFQGQAQEGLLQEKQIFTRQDTLRGSITPERAWWDLVHYQLSVTVFPDKKRIEGSNIIRYRVLGATNEMQIDLQQPLELLKAVHEKKEVSFRREGNVYFLQIPEQKKGSVGEIKLFYSGKPREARNAPWDGGFTWTKDDNGNHFIATSNQGLGASVWWPCKDHMYDEPEEGIELSISVPDHLVAVGNGRLIGEEKTQDNYRTYTWKVVNPINNYGVNINVGDYVTWSDTYAGEKGKLDLSFYVLRDNEENAKTHFEDVYRTLEALEFWFGPYPFYEDSYKLVEVPYLGMEHQSSVTYGNQFRKGYLGRDLSLTGEGLKWDFIIIHESAHEWFANNITYEDIADMWIHEGFTSYAESLFVEYHYGKDAAASYTRGLRSNIQNTAPIIGPYGVNKEGHSDMYYKGHNMLHMIRQIIDDDDKWREILRGLNEEFYHETVRTEEIEQYMIEESDVDLQLVFDQYLRDYRLPVLEYRLMNAGMMYRWTNVIESFEMPVDLYIDGTKTRLQASSDYKVLDQAGIQSIRIDPDYYVGEINLMGE